MLHNYKNPSLWLRFMAMFYEGFLLIGPVFFIVFLYLIFFSDPSVSDQIKSKERLIVQLLVLITVVLYFVWGWSNGRVTLPMRTLSLKVISSDGEPLKFKQAFIRAIIAIPSVISGIWLISGLLRKDKQCVHDIFSGTRLVIKEDSKKN